MGLKGDDRPESEDIHTDEGNCRDEVHVTQHIHRVHT